MLTKLHAHGAGFLAAEYIYINDCGPLTVAQLFAKIDFGKHLQHREIATTRALASGWLSISKRGDYCITKDAIAYFDGLEAPQPAFVGEIATSRALGAYDRPPLKYKTNSKGFRDDVPDFSVRPDDYHFHALA